MNTTMNGALVRRLGLEKPWSQQMLADESGLKLRTIQAIKSKGVASLKTRRFVAAALGVDAVSLEAVVNEVDANPQTQDRFWGLSLNREAILVGLYVFMVTLSFGFVVLTDKSGAQRVYESGGVEFNDWDQYASAVDTEGISWTLTEARLESADGRVRKRLPAHRAFWFGWYSAYPHTRLIY